MPSWKQKKRIIEQLMAENELLNRENGQLRKENVRLSDEVHGLTSAIERVDSVLKNPFMRHETLSVDGTTIRDVHAYVRLPLAFPKEENLIRDQFAREYARQLLPYIDVTATNDMDYIIYHATLYLIDKTEFYNKRGVVVGSAYENRLKSRFLEDD